MNKRIWAFFIILASVAAFSGAADAQLTVIGTATYEGNDYNLIYEEKQQLVWLDYSSRGNRWPQQVQWAAVLNEPGILSLNLKPGVKVSWEGGWRLPATTDGARTYGYDGTTTAGFNIITSEMGHLYYETLGNAGYYNTEGNPGKGWFPDSEWGFHNTGPFENLQNDMYWSGTEYAINPQHAWAFNFPFGDQGNAAFKSSYPYMGIAVRSGKVTGR